MLLRRENSHRHQELILGYPAYREHVAAHELHIALRLLEKYCPYLQNISILFWGFGGTSLAVMTFFL